MTTDHGLEPIELTTRLRAGLCPACGHEAGTRTGGSLSLHRLLGLPVRAAQCGHRDFEDHGGQSLGDWPCVCDNPFHGS